MHIVIFVGQLSLGGTERVAVEQAGYWAQRGWRVDLITTEPGCYAPFYEIHPAVRYLPAGHRESRTRRILSIPFTLPLVLTLRAELARLSPDVIITHSDNIKLLVATIGMKIPIILDEHLDPSVTVMGSLREWLRARLYPRAVCCVQQTQDACEFLRKRVAVRCEAIPSPVHIPSPASAANLRGPGQTVISLGRLVPLKQYDLLIKAFAEAARDLPNWRLVIWGEGTDRPRLEQVIQRLGLEERVSLPGATKTPGDALRSGDLYVLTSRTESFGQCLCEAMATGLPVISFDCPSGPRNIVRDGENGLLVPANDTAALTAAMRRLMQDEKERARLAARAPEVLDRFSMERIMAQWDELVNEAVHSGGR